MAVLVGRHVGAQGNSMFTRKFGEGANLGGSRNVSVMASVASSGLKEEYKLLRLKPGASEKEVKRAYRRLALQYHPDVCKGDKCSARFRNINEAYKTVMTNLEEENEPEEYYIDMDDQWEEWMGWEGGCPSRDYSNHIKHYA